jgi:hypothetical protein
MKPFVIISIALLLAAQASAQITNSTSVYKFTAAELTEAIKNKWPEEQRKLRAEAVATGRMELIQACFINPATSHDTIKDIGKLDAIELKQKATLMMLWTPCPNFWPYEGPSRSMTGGMGAALFSGNDYLLVEPFTSTIALLLPDLKLSAEMLSTQAYRANLADKMEEALNKRRDNSDVQSATEHAKKTLTSVILPPNPQTSTHPADAYSQSTLWYVCMLMILSIGLLWLALKKRK